LIRFLVLLPSFFLKKNATKVGSMTAYRGKKNIKDLGRIIRFNDEPELDMWDGEECNRLRGTDSTIFHPFMSKEEGLWAFTPDICRSMGAHYIGKSTYDGFPTSEYRLDMGDLKVRSA
jgi:scavenger receptor class B, member 1